MTHLGCQVEFLKPSARFMHYREEEKGRFLFLLRFVSCASARCLAADGIYISSLPTKYYKLECTSFSFQFQFGKTCVSLWSSQVFFEIWNRVFICLSRSLGQRLMNRNGLGLPRHAFECFAVTCTTVLLNV